MKLEAALCVAFLGNTERNDGNYAKAHMYFEAALNLGREINSERVVMAAMNGLGTLLSYEGDFAQARQLKERCRNYFLAIGDEWILSAICGSLARLCFEAGDLEGSRGYIRQAVSLTRRLGNNWSVPLRHRGHRRHLRRRGRRGEGRAPLRRGFRASRRAGSAVLHHGANQLSEGARPSAPAGAARRLRGTLAPGRVARLPGRDRFRARPHDPAPARGRPEGVEASSSRAKSRDQFCPRLFWI
ncbi:MAG: tetratricopeptide repeat protein [Verrucomicrobiota bacterium]